MNTTAPRSPYTSLAWWLFGATLAYGITAIAFRVPEVELEWQALVALLAGGSACGWLASRRDVAPPRLAPAFVVAALLVLPEPGGLIVALGAMLAGRDTGIFGRRRSGLAGVAISGAAVAVVQAAVAIFGRPESLVGWRGLLVVIALYAGMHGLGTILGRLPGADRGAVAARWATVAETATIPLGWLLAVMLDASDWLHSGALIALAVAAQAALAFGAAARVDLRDRSADLAARMTELNTLNAFGREALSSLDPVRISAALDRECGKILELDACHIALSDGGISDLRVVYRRSGDSSAETSNLPLAEGLATAVAAERIPQRIDDIAELPEDSRLRGEPLQESMRSALSVPLLIEDRVVGVLTIQSRRPRAYDDHALTVLTTITQHAVVAIENSRNLRMATVDSLTGFYHRDHFFARLDEEYQRARRYGGRFSILMLDLDGFKQINDRYGHLAGDQFLRAISETIRSELRGADMACRYGGDEFCLMLPETDFRRAQVIAERIRTSVSKRIVGLEGLAVRSTVSIGVAGFPEHDPGDARSLLRNADEALYRAKRKGRDCVVPFAA